jgi:hypothetical protein
MMWEVLFFNQNAHLANPGVVPNGSTITDLDGAARMAYLLSDMSTPWAHTSFISSPSGAGIWRFQSMSQMIQIVFLWIISQVVQPMLAANLLVLVGWIATGVATFAIARNVGCRRSIAVSCAVAVQMVPFLRFMAANFTSYVNVGLPLLCLIAALKFSQTPSKKNIVLLILSLLATSFFDPYWLLLAVFGCTIVVFIQTSSNAIRARSMRSAFIPVLVLGAYASLSSGLRFAASILGQGSMGRSVVVASRDDVGNSVLNWTSWTQSAYTGVGWLVLALFALSLVLLPWIKQRNLAVLTIVALVFISVASKISVPLTNIEVMPAVWLRHALPGVRFFDRVALIAIPLVIVVVAKTLEEVSSRFRLPTIAYFVISLLVIMLPLSYPNMKVPNVTKSYDDWSGIRSALDMVPDAKVLALPFERRGRDWIEQASFRAPLVNDLVHRVNNQTVVHQASNGPNAFVAYLESIGVTHVLSIDDELSKFLDYKLMKPRFVPVASMVLNGFGEGRDFVLTAYRVAAQPGDKPCTNCRFGTHVRTKIQVVGDLVYPPEMSASGVENWWIGDRNFTMSFSAMSQQHSRAIEQGLVQVAVSIAPCASSVEVEINSDQYETRFRLSTSAPTKILNVPMPTSTISDIVFTASGTACRFQSDPRKLLVQVSVTKID